MPAPMDKGQGCSKSISIYQYPSPKFHGDRWRYDYGNRRPRIALEGIVGSLFKPAVTIAYLNVNRQSGSGEKGPANASPAESVLLMPDIEVCFYVPGFDPDSSQLKVDVTARRGTHVDGAIASIKQATGQEDYRQHLQQAYAQMPIIDPHTGRILGRKYLYKGLGSAGSYHWRFRARHISEQNYITINIPPLMDKSDSHQSDLIDAKAPGWVYAEM